MNLTKKQRGELYSLVYDMRKIGESCPNSTCEEDCEKCQLSKLDLLIDDFIFQLNEFLND